MRLFNCDVAFARWTGKRRDYRIHDQGATVYGGLIGGIARSFLDVFIQLSTALSWAFSAATKTGPSSIAEHNRDLGRLLQLN